VAGADERVRAGLRRGGSSRRRARPGGPARRGPNRGEGPVRRPGAPDHGMLRRDPTRARGTRRHARRPPPRCRRDRDRQDEPARARGGRDQPRVGLRTHPEPVGSDQDQRRLQRGFGGRGRDRHRADQPGLGHGWFGEDPGGVLRDVGAEADAGAAVQRGDDAARPRDGLPEPARGIARGSPPRLGGPEWRAGIGRPAPHGWCPSRGTLGAVPRRSRRGRRRGLLTIPQSPGPRARHLRIRSGRCPSCLEPPSVAVLRRTVCRADRKPGPRRGRVLAARMGRGTPEGTGRSPRPRRRGPGAVRRDLPSGGSPPHADHALRRATDRRRGGRPRRRHHDRRPPRRAVVAHHRRERRGSARAVRPIRDLERGTPDRRPADRPGERGGLAPRGRRGEA
jgi:hypothetical protein